MTSKEIKSLKAEGWTFEIEHGESHHNGDPYTDYRIKSPRLNESFRVFSKYEPKRLGGMYHRILPWDWMTKAQMLDREKEAYASQRMRKDANKDAIQDAVEKALFKDPDAKKVTVTITLS